MQDGIKNSWKSGSRIGKGMQEESEDDGWRDGGEKVRRRKEKCWRRKTAGWMGDGG